MEYIVHTKMKTIFHLNMHIKLCYYYSVFALIKKNLQVPKHCSIATVTYIWDRQTPPTLRPLLFN